MAYYIKGTNGKLFEPGRKKRNYTDPDGTLYTVWSKPIGNQCIYRPYERVKGKYQVMPYTEWHPTRRDAQTELDIEAYVHGWDETEEN